MSASAEHPELRLDPVGAASFDAPPPSVPPAPPVAPPLSVAPRRARRALAALVVGLGVLVVAASVGFGAAAAWVADREHDTAVRWQGRSERQDELIAELDEQRAEAVAEALRAQAELAQLRAELAASESARQQLEAVNRELTAALAEVEQRLAEQAGVAAMARDRAALGG